MTAFPEGENVRLRALEPEDIEDLYQWENNIETWRVSNTLTPFSKHVLKQYLENAHLDIYQTRQLRLMIVRKNGNVAIGTIELFDFDAFHLRAGIGIMIHSPIDKRKGYAEEALQIFIDYAFQYLGLHQLYCNILVDNEPSLNLFQKVGFEIIARKKDWIKDLKNGWVDEYFLQRVNKN